MTVAAGNLSLALDNFMTTLANSANFQSWVGATDAAGALRSIYQDGLPPPEDGRTHSLDELRAMRPYALVANESYGKVIEAVGSSSEYANSGSVSLKLVRDVPSGIRNDPPEVAITFENIVGQIVDDLATLAGVNPYLGITAIEITDPWYRTTEDESVTEGDAQAVDMVISYG